MPAESTSEIVRPSAPGDAGALSALFRETFGIDRPLQLWWWKYWNNPNGAMSWVYESKGTIVAHAGAVTPILRTGEKSGRAMQLVDFMSRRDFPGGLGPGSPFAKTTVALFTQACRNPQIRIAYGFPGERHRLVGERILGYRPAEKVSELTLEPRQSEAELEQPGFLLDRHLSVFERPGFDLGVARTREYLAWRYLFHPQFRYRYVEIRKIWFRPPEIAAIVRFTDQGLVLMEVGGSLAGTSSMRALASRLRKFGRPVRAWCSPEHPLGRKMVEAGFQPTERDHWLEWAWLLPECDPGSRKFFSGESARKGELYYTLGDYDVD